MEKAKRAEGSEDELYNGWLRKLDVRLLSLTHGSAGAIDYDQDRLHGYYMQSNTVHQTAAILLYGKEDGDGKKGPSET